MATTSAKVPKIRFPRFTDGWETNQLGSVAKIYGRIGYRGYTVNDITKKGDGAITISPSNIADNKSVFDGNNTYISWFKYEESPEIQIHKEDIIFVKTGSTVGKLAFIRDLEEKATLNPQLVVIKDVKISRPFLFYQMLTERHQKAVKKIIVGGAMPTLSQKELSRTEIYTPDIKEQEKIAGFLTAVDERIALMEKRVELLKKYKKGVMQKIFTQQIRFKDKNGQSYPEWEEKKGGEVFYSTSERNNGQGLPILAITQDNGAIPRSEINYDISVTDASIESYKVVKKGDFIISLRSYQGGIEYSDYDGICSPAYIILRPELPIDRIFYKNLLKTDNYIKRLTKKLEGIRDGKMISYKYFSEVPLPYPSLAEQQRIADWMAIIDKYLEIESKRLQKAQEFKKSLLQRMLV